jgi:hypothetical protein
MLNKAARAKAEKLLEGITAEIKGEKTYDISLGDIEWLVITILEMDNRTKKHQDCCFGSFSNWKEV